MTSATNTHCSATALVFSCIHNVYHPHSPPPPPPSPPLRHPRRAPPPRQPPPRHRPRHTAAPPTAAHRRATAAPPLKSGQKPPTLPLWALDMQKQQYSESCLKMFALFLHAFLYWTIASDRFYVFCLLHLYYTTLFPLM